MSTVVIMPGGFHPFHAGHLALYRSAQQAFPGAEVYVAATNDTSTRPFPFAIKEKLAKLAGVNPTYFVQVKSPFRADEITKKYDPKKDRLIFVRSEKDADKPPQPGGVKKDGSPSYLQPLAGQTNIRPFGEHAYMAYLPTVEFGPGMTSATEIRSAWPRLSKKRKTALVMSLYPAAQKNPALADNVVELLNTALGTALNEFAPSDDGDSGQEDLFFKYARMWYNGNLAVQQRIEQVLAQAGWEIGKLESEEGGAFIVRSGDEHGDSYMGWSAEELTEVSENQGWAATFTSEESGQMAGTPAVGGMWAGYQQRENQSVDEDYIEEKWSAKYKRSINCSNPRGFSQRAHCQGRKK